MQLSKSTSTKRSSINIHEVSTLAPVHTHCRQSRIRQLVAVDTVVKHGHVQLSRRCRKWVIFAALISKVLSTLSPVCTSAPFSSLQNISITFADLSERQQVACDGTYRPREVILTKNLFFVSL